jgi:2,4-dienoyl-CoA reductase-like NADH-dependent reductase (Old Yellow Enzyme family)/thioredoxin reductase
MYRQKYPNLFRPIKFRGLIVKNRLMSAPNMLFRTIDGRPDEYYVRYLEHKARGGAGIVSLGEANVCDGGNHTPGMRTTLENLTIFSEMSAAVHEHGAAAAVELTHGGQNINPLFNKDQSLFVGPSATVNHNGASIREMTRDDMDRIVQSYCDAAAYYARAEFDIIHIHAGHTWLLEQFLSPFSNRRTDEYGGSLENRMRFPLEVFRKVRERVGPNQAMSARISGSERREGGFTPEDMAVFLSKAQDCIDFAEISSEGWAYTFGPTFMPHGQNAELSERIKKTGLVGIPLYAIGSISSPDFAETLLESGRADGVSMSRALIADPYLPKKAADSREEDIVPCLRCLNCTDGDNTKRHFVCSVNPKLAREARLGFGDRTPLAARKKKVLVIGGGPAGMEAAVTASERGHETMLVEKSGELGGLLKFTERDTVKKDLKKFKDYLIGKIHRSNVKVTLNSEATDELIASFAPDNIIVATGSVPILPRAVSGIENARHASDIYFDPDFEVGDGVVVIGGGLIGVEAGLHLTNLEKKVTILEAAADVALGAMGVYRMSLLAETASRGILTVTGANVREVSADGVVYEKDGLKLNVPADTVLYAVGMRSRQDEYFALCGKAPHVALIGDAKKVGKVDGAVHSGYFAAMDI